MTKAEMRAEVKRRLEEAEEPVHWTDDEIDAAINEGYEDICAFAEPYETNKLIAPDLEGDGTPYYNLLDLQLDEGFLSLRRVDNCDTMRWLLPRTALELDEMYYPQWEAMEGEAQWLILRGHWMLGVVPIKQSGTIDLKMAAIPVPLIAETDEPIFSEHFHVALVEYAEYELKCMDKNHVDAMGAWGRYVELRNNLRSNKVSGGNYGASNLGVFGAYDAG